MSIALYSSNSLPHAIRSRSWCNHDVRRWRRVETNWWSHLVTCISDKNISTQRYVASFLDHRLAAFHCVASVNALSFSTLRMLKILDQVARRSASRSSLTAQTNPSLKPHTSSMKGAGQMSDACQIQWGYVESNCHFFPTRTSSPACR